LDQVRGECRTYLKNTAMLVVAIRTGECRTYLKNTAMLVVAIRTTRLRIHKTWHILSSIVLALLSALFILKIVDPDLVKSQGPPGFFTFLQ